MCPQSCGLRNDNATVSCASTSADHRLSKFLFRFNLLRFLSRLRSEEATLPSERNPTLKVDTKGDMELRLSHRRTS